MNRELNPAYSYYIGKQNFTVTHISTQQYIEKIKSSGGILTFTVDNDSQTVQVYFPSLDKRFELCETFQKIKAYYDLKHNDSRAYDAYPAAYRQVRILQIAFEQVELWDLIYKANELEVYEGGKDDL